MPRTKNQPKSMTKIRGQTCPRMQKLRISNNFTGENVTSDNNLNAYLSSITASRKLTPPYANNPTKVNNHKSCDNCQESGNCMKILVERLSRIEDIVSRLATLTKEFKAESIDKALPNSASLLQANLYQGTNLSTCKLEELQKLVICATDTMNLSIRKKLAIRTADTMNSNLKRKFPNEHEPEEGIEPFPSNLNSTTINITSSINRHNIMNTDVNLKEIEIRNSTSPLNSEPDRVNQSYNTKEEKQDSWYSSNEKPLVHVHKRKRS